MAFCGRGRLVLGAIVAAVLGGWAGGCRRAEGPGRSEAPNVSELAVAAPVAAPSSTPSVDPERLAQALASFNRGAALLEQYRYSEAAAEFQKALERFPDWTAARFNLGVAYLNMQEQRGGSEFVRKSEEVFQQILQTDPNHRHARYCLGLYYQHVGQNDRARECFEKVHQADPQDPYAAYKLAEVCLASGRAEEATKLLEGVIALDPGFISAIYRLATLYQRARQPEKAKPLFQRFKDLNAVELSGGAFTTDQVYGAAGKYYTAIGVEGLPLAPVGGQPAQRILLSPDVKTLPGSPKPWGGPNGSIRMPALAAADLDGDGDLDLCLSGLHEDGSAEILRNDGAGKFTPGAKLADRVISCCPGDVDNDGDVDLWLGRQGEELLLLNDGKGALSKAPSLKADGAGTLTACARLLDIDSDGDLDLVAMRLQSGSIPADAPGAPAPSRVFINNRDGTYAELAEKLGLSLPSTPVAGIVYDDFDSDRDLDLVILPRQGKPLAWINDRVWQYRTRTAAETGLDVEGITSGTSGDANRDGQRDLLVFTGKEVRLYVNRGQWRFEPDADFASRCGSLGGTGGQFADMDNDGDLDIVIFDAHRRDGTRGPVLLLCDAANGRFTNAADQDPGILLAALKTQGDAAGVAADFTGDGKCDIVLAEMGQQAVLIENATAGGHYLAMDLVGVRPRDPKARSNSSAIGAKVEIRSGRLIQQHVVGVPSGPTAMPPLRLHAGLGPHSQVEWLRIIWPDSVLQAELDLAGDRLVRIEQTPRKTSSCPHLFAWDGTRFDFVADFGGMGGLGYRLGPASFARPDPTEYVPIAKLEPLEGDYVLQVTEPLEEVVYFDEAKLIAVDHPEGTEVYPHEMMAVGVPPPPFEVFCIRKPIEPVRAVDHRGVDVTDELVRVDRRYAGATELDHRFLGYAKEHFVELDFGDRLGAVSERDRLVLFLQGWVEYAYSSTNFAASQARLRLEAPSISVWREGRWVEVFREVGYPAGLRHTMTLDVTGQILPTDRKLRIRTNMELYWDRIFLAAHQADARLVLREVAARNADLHFLGYPREYSPDARGPNLLDYANLDRAVPWKQMAGQYTRFGEVGELLREADDCFVIFGPGEEVTLRFPAAAFGPVPAGYRRSFILKTDSYCKDMDLCTAHADTVEPLPFHGMSGYPYGPGEHYPNNPKTRAYRQQYNTRILPAR